MAGKGNEDIDSEALKQLLSEYGQITEEAEYDTFTYCLYSAGASEAR